MPCHSTYFQNAKYCNFYFGILLRMLLFREIAQTKFREDSIAQPTPKELNLLPEKWWKKQWMLHIQKTRYWKNKNLYHWYCTGTISFILFMYLWKYMYRLQMISSFSYFYQCPVFFGKEILRSGSNNNTNNIRRGNWDWGKTHLFTTETGQAKDTGLVYRIQEIIHVNNESSWQKRLKIISSFWDDLSSVPTSY